MATKQVIYNYRTVEKTAERKQSNIISLPEKSDIVWAHHTLKAVGVFVQERYFCFAC